MWLINPHVKVHWKVNTSLFYPIPLDRFILPHKKFFKMLLVIWYSGQSCHGVEDMGQHVFLTNTNAGEIIFYYSDVMNWLAYVLGLHILDICFFRVSRTPRRTIPLHGGSLVIVQIVVELLSLASFVGSHIYSSDQSNYISITPCWCWCIAGKAS